MVRGMICNDARTNERIYLNISTWHRSMTQRMMSREVTSVWSMSSIMNTSPARAAWQRMSVMISLRVRVKGCKGCKGYKGYKGYKDYKGYKGYKGYELRVKG